MPWYFPASGAAEPHVWALPFWGAVIVGFSFLLACYTAYVYLKVWKTPEEGDEGAETGRNGETEKTPQ